MTKFKWEAEYAIGHPVIDAQHQEIIHIMNDLHEAIQNSAIGDVVEVRIEEIFDRLAAYVETHFACEEALMEKSGYPTKDLLEHRRTHDHLLTETQRIAMSYASGDHQALEELLPFLFGDWLINHICGVDRKFAPYVTQKTSDPA